MYAALPEQVQRSAKRAYRLFLQNPTHPGLGFKKIVDRGDIYSVRIGIGYRALGRVDGEDIIWFWIGPHAEYDKLL
jgi:hypothetical protein